MGGINSNSSHQWLVLEVMDVMEILIGMLIGDVLEAISKLEVVVGWIFFSITAKFSWKCYYMGVLMYNVSSVIRKLSCFFCYIISICRLWCILLQISCSLINLFLCGFSCIKFFSLLLANNVRLSVCYNVIFNLSLLLIYCSISSFLHPVL